jgi:DNA modification methylase
MITIGNVTVHHGNCLDILPTLPDCSVDSVVTDPPYELGFMGKKWDASGIAYRVDLWSEVLRVLKPGGHLLAFGGTRTYHRMAVAIEDAGFEIRDSIHWIYGSGFPKSLDVSKAIDKAAGAEREATGPTRRGAQQESTGRYGAWGDGIAPTAPATDAAKQWEGWGTALKPAHEPVVVARRPLIGTVAANVLQYGTGALNIDGARIGYASEADKGDPERFTKSKRSTERTFGKGGVSGDGGMFDPNRQGLPIDHSKGRWPANVIFDPDAATELDRQQDGASRFFYIAKPSKAERNAGLEESSTHPTVKPLTLMRYLVRLVTPPGGTVLEPFAGSGTTLMAATMEGFNSIGIEMTDDYLPIIEGRVRWAQQKTTQKELF